MRAYYVFALFLALAFTYPSPAIAGIATTTISVGATVVAACSLPMSGEINTACTPQTNIRIGEVSAGQNLVSATTEQQPLRITEQSGQNAQTKEVMIEF